MKKTAIILSFLFLLIGSGLSLSTEVADVDVCSQFDLTKEYEIIEIYVSSDSGFTIDDETTCRFVEIIEKSEHRNIQDQELSELSFFDPVDLVARGMKICQIHVKSLPSERVSDAAYRKAVENISKSYPFCLVFIVDDPDILELPLDMLQE